MWNGCWEWENGTRAHREDGVEVAGLLHTVPNRRELVRKVWNAQHTCILSAHVKCTSLATVRARVALTSTPSFGRVEVGLCDASEHDVSDTNVKLDGMGLEEAVLRSPMVRPMPRRTTRSRWRLCLEFSVGTRCRAWFSFYEKHEPKVNLRRLVDILEMPSYCAQNATRAW